MLEHYKYNLEYTRTAYKIVQEAYPEHVEVAYNSVIRYLKRYNKRRLRIFLGETGDPKGEACHLYQALYWIAALHYQADNGNPVATPQNLDIYSRGFLQLPFATIKGGKP